MKSIVRVLVSCILLLVCFSCHVYKDRYTLGEFEVENRSSVDICIVPLLKYSDTTVKEKYYIPKNKRVKICSIHDLGVPQVNAWKVWKDSVKIEYGENCEIVHSLSNKEVITNNIFDWTGSGYKEEWNDVYHVVFVFTLTEEDYQNALRQNQR